MNVKHRTFSPDALDRNGISVAQTTAGAANLTITGALATASVATLDLPRKVGVYCAADINTVIFTITGTDRLGDALVDTVTGVNASTVLTSYDFATVTKVATSAAVGTNCEVGSGDAFATGWYPVDYHDSITNRIRLYVTPSLTWQLTHTFDNVYSLTFDEYDCDEINTALESTDSGTVEITEGITALRLAVTSFVTGDIDWNIITQLQ